jgi:KaiC/GvpD/RAD55 family RecA-like ATPase
VEEAVRSGTPAPGSDESTHGSFAPAGTQTLVRSPAGADPLSALPERAFDNLLVVSVRDHPNRVETRIERIGHDPGNVGVVPVVPAAGDYEGDLWTTDPVSPDDLTGLGMRFSDAVRHVESGSGWVVIDGLGVLLMYAEDSRVCRFFQTLSNRVRARAVYGAYFANSEVVADETYEQLRAMCDAEYEIG